MQGQEKFYNLLQRVHDKTASQEELQELMQWINSIENEAELKQVWDQLPVERGFFDEEISGQMLRTILERRRVVLMPGRKKRITPMAAAAVLLFCIGGYFLFFQHRWKPDQVAQAPARVTDDVSAPSSNNAVITLADGSKVMLENAQNGSLAMQGNVNVVKSGDGQIIYRAENASPGRGDLVGAYNLLTVPRGSKIVTLVLADGSKVWMNAESSLRYPTAFAGKERRVEITGEAFFDVAKDAGKPFKVVLQPRGDEVEVLGTQFNVNAYDDETNIKVTLLEGSVKVRSAASSQEPVVIKPGEQAVITPYSPLTIHHSPDLAQVVAWKNGYFQFAGSNTQTVMKQIARWYDVDIAYVGAIPEKQFAGQMERANNLSKVLRILEASNVHFKIEGRKVTVMP